MSDIHLSHKPPVWRSAEPDWYEAMKRPFDELRELHQNLIGDGKSIPCLIAGDIFHKWNSPPSLINLAIQCIPITSYAVPGQHDLPNHMDEQYMNSPYTTLSMAGTITDIDKSDAEIPNHICGFGWNTPLDNLRVEIALIHRYVWMATCSYSNAPETNLVTSIAKSLGNPKLIISGDNHIGFWHEKTRTFNCGGFMRRNRDQEDYWPRIGIVYNDLSVIPYYLDVSKDVTLKDFSAKKIMELAEQEEHKDELDDFLLELSNMGRGGLDFIDAIRRYTTKHGVRKTTTKLLEQILTGDK